eukprot:CAMPEP_0172178972 /NCGR_PEP_ID=MMETSP1050-20130122/16345_1 /TAXON_ID=233186 /ORGANISM="Cryptomonas curvata, Strain CCAP979/52" /LENGTH=213 /DNA_ID=CAMNT_0012851775 /DNA_START=253 /DNA_END=894 /DNA_ORIENTATION=-
MSKLFGPQSECLWRGAMDEHNRIVSRGMHMGLSPLRNVGPSTCTSLDMFLIHMRAAALADALNALARFASRVIPRVRRDSGAPLWCVEGTVLITRDRWAELSRRVVTLIRLLGFSDLDGAVSPSPGFSPPDLHRLLPAATRALEAYAPYAHGGNMWDVHPVSALRLPAFPHRPAAAPPAAPLPAAAPIPAIAAAPIPAAALGAGGVRKRRRLS